MKLCGFDLVGDLAEWKKNCYAKIFLIWSLKFKKKSILTRYVLVLLAYEHHQTISCCCCCCTEMHTQHHAAMVVCFIHSHFIFMLFRALVFYCIFFKWLLASCYAYNFYPEVKHGYTKWIIFSAFSIKI